MSVCASLLVCLVYSVLMRSVAPYGCCQVPQCVYILQSEGAQLQVMKDHLLIVWALAGLSTMLERNEEEEEYTALRRCIFIQELVEEGKEGPFSIYPDII